MKTCKACGETKDLSEFYKGVKYYQAECKRCNILRNKEWRKNNPEKRYGYHKTWLHSTISCKDRPCTWKGIT